MYSLIGVALAIGFVACIGGLVAERRRLRRLMHPTCTGRLWRSGFPTASKKQIRQFLEVIHYAFCISDKHHLWFAPDVKVLDLYYAVEPPGWSMGVDDLELERLSLELSERWGVDWGHHWDDGLTLGELFSLLPERRTPDENC